jgi:hypothetical protein
LFCRRIGEFMRSDKSVMLTERETLRDLFQLLLGLASEIFCVLVAKFLL